jgi:hypothetical protein
VIGPLAPASSPSDDSVSASDSLAIERVTLHPNHSFEARPQNKLYCRACSTEVSLKNSSIKTHIHGNEKKGTGSMSRHQINLAAYLGKARSKNTVHDCLKLYDAKINSQGQTLIDPTRVYCVQVLEALRKQGSP